MLFVLLCNDKPKSLDLRMAKRPEHLAYLESLGSKLKAAGPFLDEAGNPCGSMVIIEAENLAAATAMAEKDPYAQAGLFAMVDIRSWAWRIKNPEGA